MPKSDLVQETNTEIQAGEVDLLIGISGTVNAETLQQQASAVLDALRKSSGAARIVIAYPESGKAETANPDLVAYPLAASGPVNFPWVVSSIALKSICSLALDLNAKVCVALQADLAMLSADRVQMLTEPVLEKQCDLVLPVYPSRKFDGLLNHSILAPLVRALYGQRVRYPLAQDIGCSPRMFQKLNAPVRGREHGDGTLMWPSVLATISNYQICQVNVDAHHSTQTEGLELSAVLANVAGAAFSEMETYAPYWQRARGSQPTATSGNIEQQITSGEPVDAKPLIDSFVLGSRNLQEVWGLVLPPATLLELRKLARCAPESFRMPDELWVRIIYDFALAYRLRTINRGHLMGALTPLYLGWVASYVQEVTARSPFAAEQRFEQLARAYEEAKPYLVSRWRWPDRFNP